MTICHMEPVHLMTICHMVGAFLGSDRPVLRVHLMTICHTKVIFTMLPLYGEKGERRVQPEVAPVWRIKC